MALPARESVYQHILIFGRDGKFVFRPDDDEQSEQEFSHYNGALFAAIRYLCQSGVDLSPAH